MTITSSQRRKLRSLGQVRQDDLRVGQGGLSDGFIATLADELARKELVKVRFGELEGAERKAFAEELAAAAEAELVGVTGRTVLLYRPNPELDAAKRVLGA